MITHVKNGDSSEIAAPTPYLPLKCSPLKYQRLQRGWSQQDVVEAVYRLCVESGRPDVGITADHVRRWENRKCYPSPVYRKHLCALYGLTAEQLGFLAHLEVQA